MDFLLLAHSCFQLRGFMEPAHGLESGDMTNGTKLTINLVAYTVDLVGPVTTLLIRGDGAYVHADTSALRYCLEQDK